MALGCAAEVLRRLIGSVQVYRAYGDGVEQVRSVVGNVGAVFVAL
jgi:hypothetical protein